VREVRPPPGCAPADEGKGPRGSAGPARPSEARASARARAPAEREPGHIEAQRFLVSLFSSRPGQLKNISMLKNVRTALYSFSPLSFIHIAKKYTRIIKSSSPSLCSFFVFD